MTLAAICILTIERSIEIAAAFTGRKEDAVKREMAHESVLEPTEALIISSLSLVLEIVTDLMMIPTASLPLAARDQVTVDFQVEFSPVASLTTEMIALDLA